MSVRRPESVPALTPMSADTLTHTARAAQWPSVMTAEEAAAYLRLTENGRDIGDALKSLDYLIGKGLISPCRVGKFRRFTQEELNRFVRAQTERHRARFQNGRSVAPSASTPPGDSHDRQG